MDEGYRNILFYWLLFKNDMMISKKMQKDIFLYQLQTKSQ